MPKIGGHLSSPLLPSLPLRVDGDSQYFLKKVLLPTYKLMEGREIQKGIAWRCREEERQDHDPRARDVHFRDAHSRDAHPKAHSTFIISRHT